MVLVAEEHVAVVGIDGAGEVVLVHLRTGETVLGDIDGGGGENQCCCGEEREGVSLVEINRFNRLHFFNLSHRFILTYINDCTSYRSTSVAHPRRSINKYPKTLDGTKCQRSFQWSFIGNGPSSFVALRITGWSFLDST